MICPNCSEDYPWHVTVCARCNVDLVDRLPGPEPTPDTELVQVYSTGDPGVIALAKSLLEGESIEFMVRGEGLQDLFGSGRILTRFNPVVGPAEFWVRAEDADRARGRLRDLTEGAGEAAPEPPAE